MVSAIRDVVSVCDDYGISVIADGGIRTPGDVAKAIVAGADCVMIGNLLSGTKETPGPITKTGMWPNEVLQKKYRGSASLEAKLDRGETHNVEGYSATIPYKGKVKRIINDILDGLKSSMSYVGASNLEEFRSLAEFIRVTNSGINEAKPYLI
jgi:IMP dehydrogenase